MKKTHRKQKKKENEVQRNGIGRKIETVTNREREKVFGKSRKGSEEFARIFQTGG